MRMLLKSISIQSFLLFLLERREFIGNTLNTRGRVEQFIKNREDTFESRDDLKAIYCNNNQSLSKEVLKSTDMFYSNKDNKLEVNLLINNEPMLVCANLASNFD